MVPKLVCTLESSQDVLKIPTPRPHPRPSKHNLWRWDTGIMSSEVSTADSNMQTNLRATNEGSHPPVSKAYTSIKQRFSTYLTFNHLGICFCFFVFSCPSLGLTSQRFRFSHWRVGPSYLLLQTECARPFICRNLIPNVLVSGSEVFGR